MEVKFENMTPLPPEILVADNIDQQNKTLSTEKKKRKKKKRNSIHITPRGMGGNSRFVARSTFQLEAEDTQRLQRMVIEVCTFFFFF